MRLTRTIRQAFVSSAMNDVPSIDYAEKVRDHANTLAKKYRKAAGLPEKDLNRYNSRYIWLGIGTLTVFGLTDEEKDQIAADSSIKILVDQHSAQNVARNELEVKLTGIANSVNTSQALIKLLPEFEKYLPAEAAKTTNLPAISNMVGDFIRAGWPKNKGTASAGTTP